MSDDLIAKLQVAIKGTFDELYGLEYLEITDEIVRAKAPVSQHLKQPGGFVHGGVLCSIAESVASFGTGAAVIKKEQSAVGISNQTNFIRPIMEGEILAKAIPLHRGRTTWLWEVELSDSNGQLCAVSRMTVAVRDFKDGTADEDAARTKLKKINQA